MDNKSKYWGAIGNCHIKKVERYFEEILWRNRNGCKWYVNLNPSSMVRIRGAVNRTSLLFRPYSGNINISDHEFTTTCNVFSPNCKSFYKTNIKA